MFCYPGIKGLSRFQASIEDVDPDVQRVDIAANEFHVSTIINIDAALK